MSAIPVIAIHGGAGTILRSAMSTDAETRYHAALGDILRAGQRVLADGGTEPGFIMADLDLDLVREVRARNPWHRPPPDFAAPGSSST